VEAAFLSATAVRLEDWTRDWAQRQIGIPRGPGVPVGAVAFSLLWGAVFVAGGRVMVEKRAVG
jgi:hypothetical protein